MQALSDALPIPAANDLSLYPLHAVQLPFVFDTAQLEAELNGIPETAWHSHYNSKEYEGAWGVAPLRSVAGHPDIIYATPGAGTKDFYKDTKYLDNCPYIRSIIALFKCPVGSVRLMRLGPGAKILPHCDDMGEGNVAEFRLHIPIRTNPGVQFMVDHKQVVMLPGTLWFADFGKEHAVHNNGAEERVHLVLDCKANEWLCNMINRAMEFDMIEHFLNKIGIPTTQETLEMDTFLPGVSIELGQIKYDRDKVLSPGDLLHEAGHIAVSLSRATMSGNVGEGKQDAMGEEIATILWSYAALRAIGLRDTSVFHEQGYKGQSDWHLDLMRSGTYNGLPLLEWMGLTAAPPKAAALGIEPFPHMIRWLR